MKKFVLTWVFALNLALSQARAAPAVIGTVTASGAFRLNGDTVRSNGTLTEGAVLETASDDSAVRLAGGARLFFGSDSRGKLFGDRIILEKGETRLENGIGFHLEALGLTIRPDGETSTGRIGLLGSQGVRVAALTGSFRVLNLRGGLVAKVAAGSALDFEPLAPARAAATRLTGILTQRNGHFLLTDQVTHVTVEVTGQGLTAHVGRVVQVNGTLNATATPVTGASQVIATSFVQRVGAVSGTGGGAAAAGAGGAASGEGIGITTLAIIGGVAATATLGGLAASGALPGASQSAHGGVPPGPPITPPGQPPGRPPGTPPVTPPGRPPGRPPVSPPGLSR